ncbi:hypothetical protein HEP81_02022 [Streptomyces griseofuscus]|uniref:Uncharacterized protein n=1 Tax=Streptomyces griseofuscus TaxID=146922 RepID=A0A7H1PWB9_9ACTN|nr:hypothetical protein HEP81_02022 [Streptomyces griseofuscus]
MPCGSNGSSRAHWPFVRSPRPTKGDHQRTRSTFATDPNPDWPFAHYLGTDVVVGNGMAFIAEDGQEGYLPASVRNALAWA